MTCSPHRGASQSEGLHTADAVFGTCFPNAVQVHPEGGHHPVESWHHREHLRGWARGTGMRAIAVRDTGIGIENEMLRASSTPRPRPTGDSNPTVRRLGMDWR